ncbi:DUF6058 family natural product biosynthesis protein [Streptomyces lonegramiae]|uniref:DUF6058 family natural product biosynthesis protein n=1 Tax=Streptomyces lonegramiae TaxID=3075524 RepID=A0ABU2XMS8_9ACTN|nr:DUF6058 family natural product biosynthesis protein [Streptomyces sp. DSM 41529]MDT0546764.1 DUF6058 family natural product biosynthesis protein [Streptomyces sp. DSM 41529]
MSAAYPVSNEPDAGSAPWSERLHSLIDELDALEPAFTTYDRLRFDSLVATA